MKHLCLAFVMGWSGAAYAATGTSPPDNVPITISSSDPTLPTEAANAGFTTLAANYDFSQPLYATQSNWLDCTGSSANAALPWHANYFNSFWPTCNINQATDPVTSQTVLRQTYLGSYYPTGQINTAMQTSGPHSAITFPNMYIETVLREDLSYTGGAGSSSGVWTWQTPSNGFEFDVGELDPAAGGWGDAAWHDWRSGGSQGNFIWVSFGTNNLPSGWMVTAYHKYGILLTSDGSTSTYACGFVDDILQGCQLTDASGVNYTEHSFLLATVAPPSKTDTSLNISQYIQYIRVWSCANWASQMCNGSILFNSNRLIYWH